MFYYKFCAIYYNFITIISLTFDIIFPDVFKSDILKFQNKSIEYINLIINYQDNDDNENLKKRRRFTTFINNIIDNNKDNFEENIDNLNLINTEYNSSSEEEDIDDKIEDSSDEN
jgi:hypothetical protein